MSFFWAATNLMWGALLAVVVPSHINYMQLSDPASKVGFIIGVGAIPAILIPLIVGPMSDRCRSRLGRRRPYILVGTLMSIAALILMLIAGELKNFTLYLLSYFVIQTGSNIAMAAYSGVIPDLVPTNQRGIASGYMAMMSQAGTLIGAFVGGMLVSEGTRAYGLTYAMLAGVLALGCTVTLVTVKETCLEKAAPYESLGRFLLSLWAPLRSKDFAWVWITRALVMFGFYTVQPYLLYFLKNVVKVPNPEGETAKLIGIVLLFSILSGYLGGALSERVGRKPIVYIANTLIAIAAFSISLCTKLEPLMFFSILFGLGFGAYISVDWALGTDVLPSNEDIAKDMGVWHVSMTLPQSLAAPMAGKLLELFKVQGSGENAVYSHPGYILIFGIASVAFFLGALLLKNVRGVR